MILTVIITSFNCKALIHRAIESVPVCDEVELIIIDDLSTDGSREEIDKLIKGRKNTIYIKNEENVGEGLSINKGLDIAKGKYIGFLSDDDYYLFDVVNMFKYFNEVDMVYYNFITYEGKKIINEKTKYYWCGNSKFMRKDFIGKTRRTARRVKGDWDFYIKLMEKKPTELFTNEDLYFYDFPRKNSLTDLYIVRGLPYENSGK